MKFRITSIGMYIYHRRGTLSFSWRYRMPWWPEVSYGSCGWFYGLGRFGIEWLAFDEYDPWGEQHAEDLAEAWNMIVNEMKGDQ